jgi:hypothetical protein
MADEMRRLLTQVLKQPLDAAAGKATNPAAIFLHNSRGHDKVI